MSASSSSVVLWAAGVVAVGLVWRAANRRRRAVIPRRDQIVALFERAPADGVKVHMLNLIKFKRFAAYEDGRESELTGAAAYALYDAENRELIAQCGGSVLFSGDANTLVIGPGMAPEFDRAIIFEFPSMEAYNDVAGRSVELQSRTGVSGRPHLSSNAERPSPLWARRGHLMSVCLCAPQFQAHQFAAIDHQLLIHCNATS